ncbi:MAG: hypothetical protein VW405_12500 [Rhodospirillaceae bacterium]
MLNRRRNHLTQVLNQAALALVAEAQMRAPAEARALADLATRIDEVRITLAERRPPVIGLEPSPTRHAA